VNPNALAKLYARLRPSERLPLIIAASDRGDQAEADRLSRSVPRIRVGLPDYHGLGEGLLFLSLFHTMEQLDLGLLFWHAQGMATEYEEFPVDQGDKARADRLWDATRLLAYKLCIQADAWKCFFAELQIDPETLLRDLPCYSTLQLTERAARAMVCTAEEAVELLRRVIPGDGELPTVERAVKVMRAIIDQRVAWWG
jgi:hypothetical protein